MKLAIVLFVALSHCLIVINGVKLEISDGHICTFYDVTPEDFENVDADLDKGPVKRIFFKTSSLHTIPENLFLRYENLEFLDAGKQNVNGISRNDFRNANKLSYLRLSYNPIGRLEKEQFKSAPKLSGIYLSVSAIKEVHETAFNGLSHLKSLALGGNNIIELPPKVFHHLENLQWIQLHKNNLRFLDKDTFKFNPKLKKIFLHTNQISALHQTTFNHLANLDYLNLVYNKCINICWYHQANEKLRQISSKLMQCNTNYPNYESSEDMLEGGDDIPMDLDGSDFIEYSFE